MCSICGQRNIGKRYIRASEEKRERKTAAKQVYHSGGAKFLEVPIGSVRDEERTRIETAPRTQLGAAAAWKSRVLPAGDDRQEEARANERSAW